MRGKFATVGRSLGVGGSVALALLCGGSRLALADTNTAKGTVGGAMLGAEAVLLTESALRLEPRWAYLVGGIAGAGAGAFLGYRIGDANGGKLPTFMLAGGIALVIPTLVGVLTATQYALPRSFHSDDASPDDAEGSDPDVDASDPYDGARLELPDVGLAQAFSREELARHRVQQVTELHVMLLRGVF